MEWLTGQSVNMPGFILFVTGVFFATLFWRFLWWPRAKRLFKKRSRSVITGLVNEQLAPYLPQFPYRASETKFIGKPIDLIVFCGMDEGSVDEIVFLEIKSGKHRRLSPIERAVRDAVREKRVRWEMFDARLNSR
jgi:predicted Holliday junction resolvase-like endonuclease